MLSNEMTVGALTDPESLRFKCDTYGLSVTVDGSG